MKDPNSNCEFIPPAELQKMLASGEYQVVWMDPVHRNFKEFSLSQVYCCAEQLIAAGESRLTERLRDMLAGLELKDHPQEGMN